jgi:hypothetical protein
VIALGVGDQIEALCDGQFSFNEGVHPGAGRFFIVSDRDLRSLSFPSVFTFFKVARGRGYVIEEPW